MPKMVFLTVPEFVLMPASMLEAWADRVHQEVPELEVVVVDSGVTDPRPELADADAVFGGLTPELLASAGRLRWLQAPAASPPAGFFFPELVAHPVVVTNLRGVYRANLANHVMAMVLSFARGLPWFAAKQAERDWHGWDRSVSEAGIKDLGACTALIVGVGEVGSEVARRCRVFDMRLIGVDARPSELSAAVDELHGPDELDRLLPEADFVVLTVPHTPDTVGLMDAKRLARMKSTAILINVGRGVTVRLDDLVAALDAGVIAGAGLDVSEIEPLPPDHPLWLQRNVIITPHVAGFGADTDPEREELIVDNCRRFARGLPLRNVVDKAKWF
jgi:phosphoglycerate dehydrogenase-like enzyme